jgi:hypothetical protein
MVNNLKALLRMIYKSKESRAKGTFSRGPARLK